MVDVGPGADRPDPDAGRPERRLERFGHRVELTVV